jgi:hypothetical protein
VLNFSYVLAVQLNKEMGSERQLQIFETSLTITSDENTISFPLAPEGVALEYSSFGSVGFCG